MKDYRAYFFDLYGTLVDIHTDEARPGLWREFAGFCAARGAPFPARILRQRYLDLCAAETERLQAAAEPGAEVEPDLRRIFAALYREGGREPTETLVDETAIFFRQRSTTHLRAYAGAKELLAALRSRGRVILLSNAQSCFTLPELERLGLRDSFDRIWISSDAGRKKPDPRFYAMALEELGEDPARCLMIGNDPRCDVLGAKRAGMDALLIRSALSPKICVGGEEAADYRMEGMDLRKLKTRLIPGR